MPTIPTGLDVPDWMSFLYMNKWLVFLIAAAWTLPWKGLALWKAARLHDKKWFIIILIINTFAILDIIYIYFISERKSSKIKDVFQK